MSAEKVIPTDNDGEIAVRVQPLEEGSAVVVRSYDNDSGETIESYLCAAAARKLADAISAAADKAEPKP